MRLYYWYVQLHFSDALVVLDESGVVYYLSLGKWNTLVDTVKRDFRPLQKIALVPGQKQARTGVVESTLSKIKLFIEDPVKHDPKLKLSFIFGTASQRKVWEFLTEKTNPGDTITYREISQHMKFNTARQAGQACSANKIAVLVPCHRVVSTTASLTGYRWGLDLKRHLLHLERQAVNSSARTVS